MKRFKPIEIETTSPQSIFDDHKREVSMKIIEAIEYGIANKKKKVTFAKVYVHGVVCISLSVDQYEYLTAIEKNIENLIPYEEYETCALGMRLKKQLLNAETVT